jgi:RsiW-degrading membrane proteinase PrsW (M82 family)
MGIVVAIVAPSLAGADKLTEDEQKQILIQHIYLVILGLFFMAFVVAAGVEETMKHFVVRCCQFPSTLKDPHSILVYLLAAALGFATAENVEYVFSQGQDGMSGVAMLEGELLILLMRVLTPVHAICSVLQAVNLSKVSYSAV